MPFKSFGDIFTQNDPTSTVISQVQYPDNLHFSGSLQSDSLLLSDTDSSW